MDRTQRASRLGRIEYGRFLRAPATLDASHAAFAMNRAGPGHVDLATHFSTAVGLGPPRVGLSSAQQLLAAGTPFVYLTLTNDHQRPTEKAHDATLKWSRTLDGASGATVRGLVPLLSERDAVGAFLALDRWFQEDPGPERLAVFDDTLPNCVILPQAHPRNRAQDTTGLL